MTSNTSRTMRAWKEYCLGDGGVYFDQRPKALKALNSLLVVKISQSLDLQDGDDSDRAKTRNINVEAAVFSTCARFEILVTIENLMDQPRERKSQSPMGEIVQQAIVEAISEQICFQKRRKRYILQKVLPFTVLDLPSRIRTNEPYPKSPKSKVILHEYIKDLSKEVIRTEGVYDVSKRLCMIASGLQDRLIFRPFSARDSHVMQQMKRTSDGTLSYSTATSEMGPKSTYCKILFDTALQSGKASRSPKVLPILEDLRGASHGADGPRNLSDQAAKAAESLVIIPAAKNCVSKFKSIEASGNIKHLRERARRLLATETGLDLDMEESKRIRELLHEPTMKLREGQVVDVDQVLQKVKLEIPNL